MQLGRRIGGDVLEGAYEKRTSSIRRRKDSTISRWTKLLPGLASNLSSYAMRESNQVEKDRSHNKKKEEGTYRSS